MLVQGLDNSQVVLGTYYCSNCHQHSWMEFVQLGVVAEHLACGLKIAQTVSHCYYTLNMILFTHRGLVQNVIYLHLPPATARLNFSANSIAPPLLNVTLNVPLPCQPPENQSKLTERIINYLHFFFSAYNCSCLWLAMIMTIIFNCKNFEHSVDLKHVQK